MNHSKRKRILKLLNKNNKKMSNRKNQKAKNKHKKSIKMNYQKPKNKMLIIKRYIKLK